jgi:NAD(P)-dependent dehydrogenase (short-subunit alcohol dehydrogenase family)
MKTASRRPEQSTSDPQCRRARPPRLPRDRARGVARLIDIDLTAAHALVSLCCPAWRSAAGEADPVTSIAGDLAVPNASSYVAAKGGLAALARALAVEFGAKGITSNALSPGFFATETNRKVIASPRREHRETLPGQALGQPCRDRRGSDLPRLPCRVLRQRPYPDRRRRRIGDVSFVMHGFESTRDALSRASWPDSRRRLRPAGARPRPSRADPDRRRRRWSGCLLFHAVRLISFETARRRSTSTSSCCCSR